MDTLRALVGSSPGGPGKPGGWRRKLKLASLRATKTLIQGIASAFPTAAAGAQILSVGYWETFGVSCLAAAITAVVSLLNNVATFLPIDPTQQDAG